jgi:RHS repeat-associated protein
MKRAFFDTALAVAFAMTCVVGSAHAAATWQDYDQIMKSSQTLTALGPTLFGDNVNLQNGSLSFRVTDASLRGNNALPVAFTRTFEQRTHFSGAPRIPAPGGKVMDGAIGDWEIELPHIEGIYAKSSGWVTGSGSLQRCSITEASLALPPYVSSAGVSFRGAEIGHGLSMLIPGSGSHALLTKQAATRLPSSGGPYYWTTKDFTAVACLPSISNGSGEGFIATTADGTRYWFNWMAVASETNLQGKNNSNVWVSIARGRYGLYATHVEDRFGNWVNYTYSNSATAPVRLSSIQSSDGRTISVTYNASSQVDTVTAGSQAWHYAYAGGTSGSLTSVELPDHSRWTLSLGNFQNMGMRYLTGEPGEQWRSCSNPGDLYDPAKTYVGVITHPSGARGEFTMMPARFTRKGVPYICSTGPTMPDDPSDDSLWYPITWDTYSLASKSISGLGMTTSTWTYGYGAGDFTDVAGPTDYARYTFGNTFRQDEGLLLSVQRGDATNILQTETYTYNVSESGTPYPSPIGVFADERSDTHMESYLRPTTSTVISVQGVDFTRSMANFDAFGRPADVTESSAIGAARTLHTDYLDLTGLWVLGLTTRQTNLSAGAVLSETEFNALGQPYRIYGSRLTSASPWLQQTLAYNADGTLASVTDGRGYATSLSDWYRGVPRLIRYPATPEAPSGATESAIVNPQGWITSVTDENGYVTGYGYDAMGRLASTVYPTGDTPAWNTRYSDFAILSSADSMPAGVSPGQWRQVTWQGNYRKVTYFDAMWRPVLEHEYDYSDFAGTLRATSRSYEPGGQVAFQSYPSSSQVPAASGIRTYYDALGRVTSTQQDSELGTLTTTTAYLPGFQTRVTNPRGYATTTAYQAWGEPSRDLPVSSTMPEGKVVEIGRNPYLGTPYQLRQRAADNSVSSTRAYVYDAYLRLCKSIEPETASTVMDYDPAGNVQWTASGVSLPSTTSCDTIAARDSGRKVTRTYDARNRIQSLAFPDGRGNQTWDYWPDGLPKSVTTYNETGGSGAPVVNTYDYNRRRLLTSESTGQPGWYSWSVGYKYDANGSLATQSSPTGLSINYSPNALGLATSVSDDWGRYFARNVSYYPNGGIRQFTYGNGITHSMTQNARQLPERVTDNWGAMDYKYDYDANANPTLITDYARGSDYSRWLSYDQLDRLKDAGSCSFGGDCWHHFTYDALDNIKSWKLAGVKDYANYYYEPNTQHLLSIQNSAGASTVAFGYDAQGNVNNKNGQGYDFDFGNRLRTVYNKEFYRYDAYGRRAMSWRQPGYVMLNVYTQAGQLAYQSDESKAKSFDNIYLSGSLLATIEYRQSDWASTIKYQHTDALGSPVAVTDVNGYVLERNAYEPYGGVIGKPSYDGIGYGGHVMDGSTSLTYMQQRYYDQSVGRFISVDPIAADNKTGADSNRYRYADGNPYKLFDPDGRHAEAGRGFGSASVGDGMAGVAADATRIEQNTWRPGRVEFSSAGSNAGASSGSASGPTATIARNGQAVTVTQTNGSAETRIGGSRSWRNRNPGNMRSGIAGHPAVGRNNGFAVFADDQAGRGAMIANLQSPRYQSLTVLKAISTWAPPGDGNDPVHYANQISKWTGLSLDASLSSLSSSQIDAVGSAITRFEGWRPGTVELSQAPK